MISLCACVRLKNYSNVMIDEFASVSGFKINWREMKIIMQLTFVCTASLLCISLNEHQRELDILEWYKNKFEINAKLWNKIY